MQRTTGLVRGTLRLSVRLSRRVVSDALGAVQRLRHIRPARKAEMDDATLARKVETEIFRPADAPKGNVNVNAVDGVVYLRGELKRPEQINELERRTMKIPEVRRVENLLHLRKTPAPTRADTPRKQQRTGRPRRTSAHGRAATRSSDGEAGTRSGEVGRSSGTDDAGTRSGGGEA